MDSREFIRKLETISAEQFDGNSFDLLLGRNDRDLADIGELLVSSSRTANAVSIEPKVPATV